jgi:hypothetical protein
MTGFMMAAVLWAALLPTGATAQTTDLTEAISRNAELLARATELVRETNSVKARTALEVARRLHEGSITELDTGSRAMAGRTAREAREAILRAIAIARQEVKLEEGARKAIERARQRLEHARLALDDSGNRDDVAARKLVEEARAQLQRSHDNMQEHMFEIALRLARASSDLSGRALQMLEREGPEPERLLRELNRTDKILARVTPSNDTTRRLLDEARELQRRARDNARNSRDRLALEQTQRARNLALRLMQSEAAPLGDVDERSAARALDFTDEVITRARDASKGDAPARRKIEEAQRTQTMARNRLEQGQAAAAMRLTEQAREMAREAVRGIDRPVDTDTVRAALDNTDRELRRLGKALRDNDDAEARGMFERATRRQQEARKALENHRLRRALALTKVARNLVGNALRQLEKGNG